MDYGYHVSTNGTDNHLLLVNLRPNGITGSKVEKICELVNISINKNSVYGDTSALSPGGIRLGTSPLTSRNFVEEDFEKVALFLHQCIQLAIHVQEKSGKKMKDFNLKVEEDEEIQKILKEIKRGVNEFALEFPLYD